MLDLERYQAKLLTPFAVLGIRTLGERLTGIDYLPRGIAQLEPQTRIAMEACHQLTAYMADPMFLFDLPFDMEGTVFQRTVWHEVRSIRSGNTLTYSEVALRIGSAPRPVGSACGANRLPLLIPCHRVIANRGIGGFMHSRKGQSLEIKRWLLRHENETFSL